ncbi:unnamed protein product [Lactuca saligna]|uniref:SAM domain-containing protein n=1 Tax=Lactuca saligna TaxID=75948 RepID=A0AA35UZ53_LACSI|nr:unnamed protein product [Lactuca saligna]
MAEVQPPVEGQVNGGSGGGIGGGVSGTLVGAPAETVPGPTKRQRRPSVRLGEIGDQHNYDNHRRTKQQQWRYSSKEAKTSKTRQLMNLSGGAAMEYQETLDVGGEDKDGGNKSNHNLGNSNNNNPLDCVAIGSWKVRDSAKSKRGFSMTTKRVRSNWVSKINDGDEKFEEEDDFDDVDRYTDYEREGSGSQLKEPSLNLSMDNERDLHYGNRSRDGTRVRVSDGPSDTDARNWNNNNPERNGVRVWLNQLGLGRYAPIFEVHEVDDEVLPLLTLEDLKDMGINAVGSRRKMFCSIQKLGKGFS